VAGSEPATGQQRDIEVERLVETVLDPRAWPGCSISAARVRASVRWERREHRQPLRLTDSLVPIVFSAGVLLIMLSMGVSRAHDSSVTALTEGTTTRRGDDLDPTVVAVRPGIELSIPGVGHRLSP
jgi:hypothetical protein